MPLDDKNGSQSRLTPFPLYNTSALHERRLPTFTFSQDGETNPEAQLPTMPSRHSDSDHSLDDLHKHISWKERIKHFHWNWYTLSMSTGGIANVIYNVPDDLRFTGLYEIGLTFFLLNICIFIFNCIMISLRFYFWPSTFKESFKHPNESLFIPAIVISLATDLINVTQYGLQYHKAGTWLIDTMVVLYWIYVALAMTFSIGILLVIWSTQTFTLAQMTPVWIFPAYPLLMVGPFAAVLSDPRIAARGHGALNIIIGGVVVTGIGFLVSIMIYSAYIYRLMSQKLPREPMRPTMFISVGPTGFTVFALINMGYNFPQVVHRSFMGDGELTGQITKVLAYWSGIWLWGLGLWFFVVSVGAHWSCVSHNRLHFALNWNGFIFPNTAFVTGTFAVAKALDNNKPIEIVGCVMACLVTAAWVFVFGMCIRAVILRQILWPSKQDDKDVEILRRQFRRHTLDAQSRPGMHKRGASHLGSALTSPLPHESIPSTPLPMDLEAQRFVGN